uniref:Uncharacterized protein n=1 Tax=Plectus sambesii TaxID=2011161 RepID=A0A914XK13_9BILA
MATRARSMNGRKWPCVVTRLRKRTSKRPMEHASIPFATGPQRPPPPPLLPTARFLFHSIGFLPGVRFDVCPESDCARINHAASTAPSDAPPNAAALC